MRSCIGKISTGSARSSRSEEHTSELHSRRDLVCRLLLEKKKIVPAAMSLLSILPVWMTGSALLMRPIKGGGATPMVPKNGRVSGITTPGFFFTVSATPEIYTLSLHDALPI